MSAGMAHSIETALPAREGLQARDNRRAGRAELLGTLADALTADSFTLYYQPIIDLRGGGVAHYEALLRIPAAGGALRTPGRYLQAAEESGLIVAVDRAVIARAIRVLAYDPRFFGAALAVNISGLSATDESLPDEIERLLEEHGVEPARLTLEVTETAAIQDMAGARAVCRRVRALGCEIAIDDFGAGFGSFQYLKHLPFDYLKIDGEFIRALPNSRTDQLVVSALAGIVAGLGRLTIAEFVGDERTLELLREYGVDMAQGHAVGRPAAEPLLIS
jgi:EAL domain-containing protein (putative c-di-GMP-specific phosphodiesterase class I)